MGQSVDNDILHNDRQRVAKQGQANTNSHKLDSSQPRPAPLRSALADVGVHCGERKQAGAVQIKAAHVSATERVSCSLDTRDCGGRRRDGTWVRGLPITFTTIPLFLRLASFDSFVRDHVTTLQLGQLNCLCDLRLPTTDQRTQHRGL